MFGLCCIALAALADADQPRGLRGAAEIRDKKDVRPGWPLGVDAFDEHDPAAARADPPSAPLPLSARFERYKKLLARAAAEHDRAGVAEAAAAPADLGTAFGAARLSVHTTDDLDAEDEDKDIEDEFLGWSYDAHETEANVIGAPEEVARLKNLLATANAKDEALGHHAGDGFFARARDDDYGGDGGTAADFGGELDDDAYLDDKDIDDPDDEEDWLDALFHNMENSWALFDDKDFDDGDDAEEPYWSDFSYPAGSPGDPYFGDDGDDARADPYDDTAGPGPNDGPYEDLGVTTYEFQDDFYDDDEYDSKPYYDHQA